MKTPHKLLLGLVLIVGFLGTGGLVYYLHYLRHEPDLTKSLNASQTALNNYKEWLDGRTPAEEKLRRLAADWTLGFNGEVVDSRFRSGLTRMAESAGLVKDKIVVTPKTGVTLVRNPTVDRRNAVSEFKKYISQDYMAEADVYLKAATLRGSGTFSAVNRLLALAQIQPWIWSVKGFTLKPQNDEATMFDITIEVTTALLPDLAPPAGQSPGENPMPVDAPLIIDPTAEGVAAIAAIVQRNVFAPPPEPVAPIEVVQNPPANPGDSEGTNPPPPPALPYHEWRLTGVSGSPTQGRLAWMLNSRTGSAVLLSPGERLLDAELVRADVSKAVFQIGKEQFVLALNETLADRRRVE